jgi:prophage antirepressor-like protein
MKVDRITHTKSTGDSSGQQLTVISESGLYKLVMRAQRSNPAAAKFQDGVTREVLPSIRKTGAYVMGQPSVKEVASAVSRSGLLRLLRSASSLGRNCSAGIAPP